MDGSTLVDIFKDKERNHFTAAARIIRECLDKTDHSVAVKNTFKGVSDDDLKEVLTCISMINREIDIALQFIDNHQNLNYGNWFMEAKFYSD